MSEGRVAVGVSRRGVRRLCVGTLLMVAALLPIACGEKADPDPNTAPTGDAVEADRIRDLVDSEEMILRITPFLVPIATSVLDLRMPGMSGGMRFASEVAVRDLAPESAIASAVAPASGALTTRVWSIEDSLRSTADGTLDLWRPLFDAVDYFDHAKFDVVRGAFDAGRRDRWRGELEFRGLARSRAGHWMYVRAEIDTHWTKTVRGAPPWRIDRFALRSLTTLEGRRRLFAETLDSALPDPALRRRARASIHEEYLLDFFRDRERFEKPHPYFRIKPTDWQPGLAVVDLEADGFDDVYVMDRWGKNLLLRNRGDGTFENVAGAVGLDVENHSSSAVFADFDNDGDPDLFLGRTLAPSAYFENEGGRFVDRSAERVTVKLPALVASVAAADVDGNGLLDVYFSTYAAELVELQRRESSAPLGSPLLEEFVPGGIARALGRRWRDGHLYMARVGPPNVLLLNRGGHFEPAPPSPALEVWRHTFQSTFSDFDDDGDPDLYVANDFSSNNMLRNEGDGTFVDVTDAMATADVGFGMGASFGDYDNDGRQDLYVTNMYSKAGRRITEQVPGLDPKIAQMSRGNSLFRNLGDGFEKVSGLDAPALQVERAGWSWGGQFVDVDNDGYLDVYASSGFYTAPDPIALVGADL